MQPSRFFALTVVALLILLYPLAADAGDRRWIVDRDGETVGYLELGPYGSDTVILRDSDGNTVGVIEDNAVGNGDVVLDRHGDRLGRVEGRRDGRDERGERQDWRDGPRTRWGSYEDRWGP